VPLRLGELWRYRELLYFLTWRDVKVRYTQTVLGVAWAVLQPFMQMVVFTIFFGKLGGMEKQTGGIPYEVYSFAGLLPWTFFANAVSNSANSLVGSANLITKVYFPRLVIPLAAVGAGLVDFGVASGVLLLLMAFFRIGLSVQLLLVPLLLALVVVTATGVGMVLSALTAAYRDFRYVVPFMVQTWMFVTPVIFVPSIVPQHLRWILKLNPMYGVIDGFRAAFLGLPLDLGSLAMACVSAVVLFLGGAIYFRRTERRFADII
jgi:lipopolysaccharide transport system permease protein